MEVGNIGTVCAGAEPRGCGKARVGVVEEPRVRGEARVGLEVSQEPRVRDKARVGVQEEPHVCGEARVGVKDAGAFCRWSQICNEA